MATLAKLLFGALTWSTRSSNELLTVMVLELVQAQRRVMKVNVFSLFFSNLTSAQSRFWLNKGMLLFFITAPFNYFFSYFVCFLSCVGEKKGFCVESGRLLLFVEASIRAERKQKTCNIREMTETAPIRNGVNSADVNAGTDWRLLKGHEQSWWKHSPSNQLGKYQLLV